MREKRKLKKKCRNSSLHCNDFLENSTKWGKFGEIHRFIASIFFKNLQNEGNDVRRSTRDPFSKPIQHLCTISGNNIKTHNSNRVFAFQIREVYQTGKLFAFKCNEKLIQMISQYILLNTVNLMIFWLSGILGKFISHHRRFPGHWREFGFGDNALWNRGGRIWRDFSLHERWSHLVSLYQSLSTVNKFLFVFSAINFFWYPFRRDVKKWAMMEIFQKDFFCTNFLWNVDLWKTFKISKKTQKEFWIWSNFVISIEAKTKILKTKKLLIDGCGKFRKCKGENSKRILYVRNRKPSAKQPWNLL